MPKKAIEFVITMYLKTKKEPIKNMDSLTKLMPSKLYFCDHQQKWGFIILPLTMVFVKPISGIKKTKENDIMIKYLDLNGVEITKEVKSVFYHNGEYKNILIPCFYDVHTLHTAKELQGFEDTMGCDGLVYFIEDYKMEKIDDNTFKLLEIEVRL